MTLTPYQIAVRHLATEVEYINRLLGTRDLSKAKAKLMLADAVTAAAKAAGETFTVKFGIHQNRAWFSVL